jgi:hypothetical protein
MQELVGGGTIRTGPSTKRACIAATCARRRASPPRSVSVRDRPYLDEADPMLSLRQASDPKGDGIRGRGRRDDDAGVLGQPLADARSTRRT